MLKALQNPVRALRELRGLSQVALAGAAKLTRQSVNAIETGRACLAVGVGLARVGDRWVAHARERSEMRNAADGFVARDRGSRRSLAVQRADV